MPPTRWCVTMLLHMLRHFAFDRLRGFRWFSWVTGVALIWLVYVAGVNGYMLPWDQLAQFVIASQLRVARLAARLRRHADPQLHLPAQRQRPLLLAAGLHPHRRAAADAAADVGACAARAQGQHQPPRPIASAWADADRAVAGACRCSARAGRRSLDVSPTTLRLDWFLLPLLSADRRLAARRGVGAARWHDRAAARRCRGCRRGAAARPAARCT